MNHQNHQPTTLIASGNQNGGRSPFRSLLRIACGLLVFAISGSAVHAQSAPTLTLSVKGSTQAPKSEAIRSVSLGRNADGWYLLLLGTKEDPDTGKRRGCQLRSADRATLTDIHRALVSPGIGPADKYSVTCTYTQTLAANSSIGIVNLDEKGPEAGTFQLYCNLIGN